MAKYDIRFGRKIFYNAIVEADTEEQAIEKAESGDVIEEIEDEFMFPSYDWEVIEVRIQEEDD